MFSSGYTQDRSALLPFFLLVFALSTPLWFLQALTGIMLLPGLPLSALAAFCPALSALLLILRSDGRRGAAALLARGADAGRASLRGLALAVLLPLGLTFLSYAILRIWGLPVRPHYAAAPIAVTMFVAFLIAALGEELGWSGYAIDPLQQEMGAFPAALLLGLIWSVWHYVPLLQAGRDWQWIGFWTLATTAMRVVMVWLYNNTGRSVFAVALLHAMGNLCAFGAPSLYDPRIEGALLAALAVAVTLFWGPRTLARAGGIFSSPHEGL